MKKYIFYSTIIFIALFSCNESKEADVNLTKFNKNLVVAKQFIEAFSSKDSTKEASLLAEDLIATGPGIGQDSISKKTFINGDKDHMITFSDIKLNNAEYSPGLDANYKISPDVRVYGTWIQKFVKSGKISKMKWYAEFKINDAGKIFGYKEYCELADMSKELDR